MKSPPRPTCFRLRLWLWARLLPAVAKRLSLERLLSMATAPLGPKVAMPAEEIIAEVKRVVRRPWRMRGRRCLREGLLAFRFLRLAGHPAVIHFGVDRTSVAAPRLRAHCWVSLHGEPILNAPGEELVLLMTYDGSYASNLADGRQAGIGFAT